ncbi:hypothetical protein MMC21_006526 [Puttea exsequens]|nr:hypothetical protein [Puttea exsequens]
MGLTTYQPTAQTHLRRYRAILASTLIFLSVALFALLPLHPRTRTATSSFVHPFRPPSTNNAAPVHPPWLIAVSVSARNLQRRTLIRYTWMDWYARAGHFEGIFFLARPDPAWADVIQKENATYGDILVLDGIEEDSQWTATHTKPLELLKVVAQGGWKGRKYDFVSKVDEDSWIEAKGFYEDFLRPRLEDEQGTPLDPPNMTMIGCLINCDGVDKAPAGGFETFSWDMVDLLPRLHEEFPNEGEAEDCLMGKLLEDARIPFEFVDMIPDRGVDVNEVGHAFWGEEKGELEDFPEALVIHNAKTDEMWMRVVGLYDENGWTRDHAEG